MNPLIRNILAVVAGAVLGGVVNAGLINISGSIIPPPEGIDMTTVEGIVAGQHLLQPKHFIMPFLAHALGTLVGAFTAAKLAASHHQKLALGIGALFLIGGITAASMIPAPIWFNILDLVVAYLPMGWLGHKLANKN